MAEVEETLKRIHSHKGVIGVVVVNKEGALCRRRRCHELTRAGIAIKTTLDQSTTVQYASLISQLAAKARSTIRDIDPQVGAGSQLCGSFSLVFGQLARLNVVQHCRLCAYNLYDEYATCFLVRIFL